jgi:hypothetical protein
LAEKPSSNSDKQQEHSRDDQGGTGGEQHPPDGKWPRRRLGRLAAGHIHVAGSVNVNLVWDVETVMPDVDRPQPSDGRLMVVVISDFGHIVAPETPRDLDRFALLVEGRQMVERPGSGECSAGVLSSEGLRDRRSRQRREPREGRLVATYRLVMQQAITGDAGGAILDWGEVNWL